MNTFIMTAAICGAVWGLASLILITKLSQRISRLSRSKDSVAIPMSRVITYYDRNDATLDFYWSIPTENKVRKMINRAIDDERMRNACPPSYMDLSCLEINKIERRFALLLAFLGLQFIQAGMTPDRIEKIKKVKS